MPPRDVRTSRPALGGAPPPRPAAVPPVLGVSGAAAVVASCEGVSGPGRLLPPGGDAAIEARPDAGARPSLEPGLRRLGIEPVRDTTLFVPEAAVRGRPFPLLVALHGAAGGGGRGLGRFRLAAERGVALMQPLARERSWDVIVGGGFGVDVEVIDASLATAFARIPVDPERVALAGFSDGASYALSVGLANGGLFRHLIACSPGFVAGEERRGHPEVFVSHGTRDGALPIDGTSREIVPALRDDGYDVTYVEFDGTHELPDAIVRRAIRWWLDGD